MWQEEGAIEMLLEGLKREGWGREGKAGFQGLSQRFQPSLQTLWSLQNCHNGQQPGFCPPAQNTTTGCGLLLDQSPDLKIWDANCQHLL